MLLPGLLRRETCDRQKHPTSARLEELPHIVNMRDGYLCPVLPLEVQFKRFGCGNIPLSRQLLIHVLDGRLMLQTKYDRERTSRGLTDHFQFVGRA